MIDEELTYLMEGRLKQIKYELDFLNEFVKSDYVNPEEVIKTRINYLKEMIKEFKTR